MTPGFRPGRHLALVGPTASGKSAVAVALATRRCAAGTPTEIVSCDSMQVYRGMDVGTAKPTDAERGGIPHHLLDLVEPSEDHNLADYLRSARTVLGGIEDRGGTALVVGGTGLYVRGIVDGFEPPPHFPQLRAELETEDTASLTRRLEALDPEALSRIPAGNRRRLVRALEVTLGTDRPFSEHGEQLDRHGPTPFVMVGLASQRDELERRIAVRFDQQMADGFLQEVSDLASGERSLSRSAAQALGYRELMCHVRGEVTLDEAMDQARLRTRRFAVRQLRWFRRDRRIEWFDAPRSAPEIEHVAAAIDELWRKRAAGVRGSVATVDPGPSRPVTGDPGVRPTSPQEQL